MILWRKLFAFSPISGWCSADGPVGRRRYRWHKLNKNKRVFLNSATRELNKCLFPCCLFEVKNSWGNIGTLTARHATMPYSGMTDVSGPSYAQMPTAVRYSFVDWVLPKLPRRHEPTKMPLENQPHIIRPAIILRMGYSVYSVYIYQLTLKAPITTAADDIHKYFFHCFSEKMRLDVSSESSARQRQRIHMKKIKPYFFR